MSRNFTVVISFSCIQGGCWFHSLELFLEGEGLLLVYRPYVEKKLTKFRSCILSKIMELRCKIIRKGWEITSCALEATTVSNRTNRRDTTSCHTLGAIYNHVEWRKAYGKIYLTKIKKYEINYQIVNVTNWMVLSVNDIITFFFNRIWLAWIIIYIFVWFCWFFGINLLNLYRSFIININLKNLFQIVSTVSGWHHRTLRVSSRYLQL